MQAWAKRKCGQSASGHFLPSELPKNNEFIVQRKEKVCTEGQKSQKGNNLRENQTLWNLSYPVSSGHGSYRDELGSIREHLFLLETYLPTINLIVFVQTPFKARAKDTATKQNQQTEKKSWVSH